MFSLRNPIQRSRGPLVYLIARETCHTRLNLKAALTDTFIKLLNFKQRPLQRLEVF